MGIISLFPFLHSCAQTKKVRGAEKNTQSVINQVDAKGLKQGYWIIRDTTYFPSEIPNHKILTFDELYPTEKRDSLIKLNEKKDETQKIVNDVKLIATIYIAEGSYQNNFKQGLWKYSVSNAPHYSEVRYNSDEILSILIYDKAGHIQLKAIPNYTDQTVYYEQFNDKNQSTQKGTFPLAFLYATTQRFKW